MSACLQYIVVVRLAFRSGVQPMVQCNARLMGDRHNGVMGEKWSGLLVRLCHLQLVVIVGQLFNVEKPSIDDSTTCSNLTVVESNPSNPDSVSSKGVNSIWSSYTEQTDGRKGGTRLETEEHCELVHTVVFVATVSQE